MQPWDELDASRFVSGLYQDSDQPAAVVDEQVNLVWSNPQAREYYPFLCTPDGIHTMLREEVVCRAAEKIREGASCRVYSGSAPLFGSALFFSPLEKGFALVLFESPASPFPEMDVDTLVSVFSGQIRSPLTNIFTSLDLLARNRYILEAETLRKPLRSVRQNSYRLLRYCANLTEYFRYICAANPLRMQRADLGGALYDLCLSLHAMMQETGTAFEFSISKKPVYCRYDWNKLEFALLNILSNACHYAGRGNVVRLTLEKQRKNAMITVTDKGIGIAPEYMPQVFHPFFSHDESPSQMPGGGLGLTVAKFCVQAHGGTITLTSIPGEGTTAAVSLPLTSAPEIPSLSASRPVDMACDKFSPIRVLLADSCPVPWPDTGF